MAACEPNAAHVALAGWQARHASVRIATQNVDGLHARACRLAAARGPRSSAGSQSSRGPRSSENLREVGSSAPSEQLLEIHGTLFRVRCTSCNARYDHRETIDASSEATLPTCDTCGGLLRPDVVWFGEALDSRVIATAFGWAEEADICLVVGTSALVQPAASLATVTRETGGRIVEVNPEQTPLTELADVSIRGGAAAIIPRLIP